jgi:phosphatidylcholine synthase
MARTRKTAGKPARKPDRGAHIAAFAVHVFTAAGAACAIMALIAAARADFVTMFGWLGAALVIDGVDGTLARHVRTAQVLPRWSGETLDLVVDFSTYVLVPAFALAVGGVLPPPLAVALAIAVVMSSAIYCADTQMKTEDNCFRGFPVLWNIAAFHLFVLKAPPAIAAVIVLILIGLTFAPLRTIHPLRVLRWRAFSLAALVAWAALAIHALLHGLDPGPWVTLALTALAVYFLGAGLFLPRK